MSITLSANTPRAGALTDAATTNRGLTALLIGGAVLIIAMWWAVIQLSSTLARVHVEQRMTDVAAKAGTVLRQASGITPQARQALVHLARFRDIARMELRDAQGTVLWRNYHSVSRVRHPLPAAGHTLLEKRNIDGLSRDWARHHAILTIGGQQLHLLLEADMTPILASYRQVALLVAKAFTTVLLAVILLMGWLLMRRQRLETEHTANDDWRNELEAMQARNAHLLRRMARLANSEHERTPSATPATTEENRHHA